jgi:hypothetical protein
MRSAHRAARAGERAGATARQALAAWLTGPLLLAASGAALALVLRGPDALFGWAVGATLALALGWILVCALFPARPDRRCPRCGAEALERLDRGTTRGLVCRACDHRDAHASSFLLAEAEGPLEPLVLAQRGRRVRSPARAAAKGARA